MDKKIFSDPQLYVFDTITEVKGKLTVKPYQSPVDSTLVGSTTNDLSLVSNISNGLSEAIKIIREVKENKEAKNDYKILIPNNLEDLLGCNTTVEKVVIIYKKEGGS